MSPLIKNLKDLFGDKIRLNEKLSKYNWFNSGGPAELFFKAENEKELASFLSHLKPNLNSINIIGAGSNTLIRDGGVKGATIKLSSNFSFINLIEKNIIEAGAATLDKNIANFSKEQSLSGLEFLSCIPGSVGGGIRMNSGCYDSDFSKILTSIKVMDFNGSIKEIKRDQINFFYRGCSLPENLIILSVKLQGIPSKKELIEAKQKDFIQRKIDSQPKGVKTCGSTFKNPEGTKAWKLIKESKSDKLFVGDVKISEKHSNFFINNGSASSFEIEQLINKVKENVFKETGKKLELEIKIIGNNI